MNRVSFPKVALISYSRPKKLSFNFKLVHIISDLYKGRAALVPFKEIEELKPKMEEMGATDFFLLDEQRFLNYQNLHDAEMTKEIQSLVKDKQIVSTSMDMAKKSKFSIHDIDKDAYWTLR